MNSSFNVVNGVVMFDSHMLVRFPTHEAAVAFVDADLPQDEIEGLGQDECEAEVWDDTRSALLRAVRLGQAEALGGLFACGLRITADDIGTVESLTDLFSALKAGAMEITDDLPTFGGADVVETGEVWSWDATRKIVGTCADDLALVERDDVLPAGFRAHDGVTEWADCSACGAHLDPVNDSDALAEWDGGCYKCGAPAARVGLRVTADRGATRVVDLLAEVCALDPSTDDGTDDLGIIVRQAIADDPDCTAQDILGIVREARQDAATEAARAEAERAEDLRRGY